MGLNNILISFLLHLGVLLPVTADQHAYAIAGKPFTLSCPDAGKNQNPGTVIWKHNGTKVLNYMKGRPWKGKSSLYKYKGTDNGEFSLEMPEAEEGLYTCAVDGRETNIHLRFLKVTGSPEGSLLQGESLELQLHPASLEQVTIEWISPRHERGNPPHWTLMDNNQRLRIKELHVQDDGIWKCSVLGLVIPYKVTVIGFLSASDKEIFAAVNSTVTFSHELHFNSQHKNDLNIKEQLLTGNISGSLVFLDASGDCDQKKIPNVQFKDAGWYPCSLRFNRGYLNKTIHLIVMEVVFLAVFATPPGPLFKEGEVKFCCSISAPLPPGALLRWDSGNETKEISDCLVIRTAGLWTCSLIVEDKVKIRVNYTVEEASLQPRFPLMESAWGAGVALLLLALVSVCLSTYVTMKRKKQRVERMAQAKQHLLAKRTCQCQSSNMAVPREAAADTTHHPAFTERTELQDPFPPARRGQQVAWIGSTVMFNLMCNSIELFLVAQRAAHDILLSSCRPSQPPGEVGEAESGGPDGAGIRTGPRASPACPLPRRPERAAPPASGRDGAPPPALPRGGTPSPAELRAASPRARISDGAARQGPGRGGWTSRAGMWAAAAGGRAAGRGGEPRPQAAAQAGGGRGCSGRHGSGGGGGGGSGGGKPAPLAPSSPGRIWPGLAARDALRAAAPPAPQGLARPARPIRALLPPAVTTGGHCRPPWRQARGPQEWRMRDEQQEKATPGDTGLGLHTEPGDSGKESLSQKESLGPQQQQHGRPNSGRVSKDVHSMR
ncbi:uncharacterized protein LOC129345694 [Eublepharis macularius]|uniref:Uncharacterized protein LOC129345694 n=1 Tax=Eublepharis macularius TaxID=481883 RepID=A0AA97KQA2_EUBMA|nr:uncharacterized protein LOC129345694 [Eublepharis macularius]